MDSKLPNSDIVKLAESGNFTTITSYSLAPLEALVCYLEQTIKKNYRTWEYWDATKSEFYGKIVTSIDHKRAYYDTGADVIIARAS